MFDVDCPTCGSRVLLGTKQITDVRNLRSGIEVAYRCRCGTPGVWRAPRPQRP